MASLLSTIFGCFQKKEKANDLPTWLETHFPGELVVVNNIVNLDPMNLFIKEKNTILADKNDPEVQISVTWNKKQDGLGINANEVKTSLEESRRDVQTARHLFKALKENGLGKISVGVIDMAAYILIYEEPVPELRKDYIGKIIYTLNALPNQAEISIWTECMEPAIYQADFKDIIPFGYWKRGGTYHETKKIMSHHFDWPKGLVADVLNLGWEINSMSERTSDYRKDAYPLALAWAEKNLPSPFYLEKVQMVAIEPYDEDPLALIIHFPYFSSMPDTEISGFEESSLGDVSVFYQTEQKKVIHIEKTKE